MFKWTVLTMLFAVNAHAATWTFDFAGESRTGADWQRALPGLTATGNAFTLGMDCDDCPWYVLGAPAGTCFNAWHRPEGAEQTCGAQTDSDFDWNQNGNFANEPTPGRALSVDHGLDADAVCPLPYIKFSKLLKWVRITYSSSAWECTECEPAAQCCYEGALFYPGLGREASVSGCRHAGSGCAWNTCYSVQMDEDGSRWHASCAGDPNGDFCAWYTVEMTMPAGVDYLLFNLQPFQPYPLGVSYPQFYIGKLEVSDGECPQPPCEFERAGLERREGVTPAARTSWGRLKVLYR